MEKFWNTIVAFFQQSGIAGFFQGYWLNLIMIVVACVLLFLAIKKDFEPYLLLPIAFGMLLVNLPHVGEEIFNKGGTEYNYISLASKVGLSIDQAKYLISEIRHVPVSEIVDEVGIGLKVTTKDLHDLVMNEAFLKNAPAALGFNKDLVADIDHLFNYDYSGIFGFLYYGVKWGIYPCLIFLCIGATTDFGPLIANKKTMLLGAAAQIGIFITFIGAIAIGKNGLGWTQFDARIASSIGIIGGADGPTAILVTTKLAPEYLSSIAIVAYSYMALVPVIQPPIIRLLTLGNLIKESGVVPKIRDTLANSLMYIVTILLGVCVGMTADAQTFLTLDTILIFGLGIIAFAVATAAGVLGGKLMCFLTKGKVNPMIGAAGVSAVPMAARVVHKEGLREDPTNFLLMHAMGPNVAGVIGSAVAAGVLLLLFA